MKPCIVWQTDFGLSWGAVASMVGVCKQVDPELECIDITHEIEAYNILAASREIIYVEPFWPKGTVFVSVVAPVPVWQSSMMEIILLHRITVP